MGLYPGPMAPTCIVVIEDNGVIADAVVARLESEGFEVRVAIDGPSGVDLVAQSKPALVVLDLMLPGLDGLEVCRAIQADRRVPVLMLTAKNSETDMLVGLAVGADDYLTKPFSPRELVARIRAILRRSSEVVDHATSSVITIGSLRIDSARRRVHSSGVEVPLTATELDLLSYLAQRPDVVFTRAQLMVEVWGYSDAMGARTIDSHIRALRKKLGIGAIRTVHGVGYAIGIQP